MSASSSSSTIQPASGNDTEAGSSLAGLPPMDPAHRIVAIDGPAGAGKSTVAARIAARFSLLNLETGAMYRAFALKALRLGLHAEDAAALEQLTHATNIGLEAGVRGNRVLLDDVDVTAELRTPEVTEAASLISVHPPVRAWLVALQRALGAGGNVVMEGRDIGTAVFPEASVKVFLDASPEARSERRYRQGGPAPDAARAASLQRLQRELHERDQRDRTRSESPLRPAPDAVVIDSTSLTLDEVVEQVSGLITRRWFEAQSP